MLPEEFQNPMVPLLQDYIVKGIPVHTGSAWTQRALERANAKGPHASTYTPNMTAFIFGELHQRVQDGFSIRFPEADAVRLFGDNL